MQMRKTLVVGGLGLVALIVAVVFSVAIIAPVFAAKPGPDSQFTYPISWQPAREPDSGSTGSSILRLNEDGTADITSVQLGEIRRTADGRQCVEGNGDVSSGRGLWEVDGDGVLRVNSDSGDAVFLPGRGRFTGPDWSELRQPFCDHTYVDFSPIV